ncbi:MAG: PAS domain S-box protein, partial [Deferrisomatales bacterium]
MALCAAATAAAAAGFPGLGPDPLSPEERAFLRSHGPVRYAPDPAFAPFEFFDPSGAAVGITPDLLAVLSRRLGVELRTVHYSSWPEVLEAARRGEVDLLGTLTRTPEREAFLAYGAPYLWVRYALFVRDGAPEIRDLGDVGPGRLGVVRGYGIEHWLAVHHPGVAAVPVPDPGAGLAGAAAGQLDAVLEALPVGLYAVAANGLPSVRVISVPVPPTPQHLAVPRGREVLLGILEKGLATLTPWDRTEAFVRWTGQDLSLPEPGTSPLLGRTLAALAALLALGAAWIVALRQGVARQTRSLRESEERYRSLLRSIPDPVALYDLDGTATYVNPSFTEVFGFTLDEVRGRRIPFVPEEEAAPTGGEIRRVLAGERCVGFETRRRTRDGRLLHISLSSSVYHDHQGRPAGIAVVLRDVTDRRAAEEALRASEQRYRLLASNARDVIWTMDLEGRFTYVSPSVERLRGFTPAELTGKTLRDALTPDSLAAAEAALHAALEREARGLGAAPLPPLVLEQPRKDGSTVWVEAVVALVRDGGGRLIGVQGVTRDITERRRADEEKAALGEQLRQAQKMEAIGTLAGGVAHDFNNILAAVMGYAELALLDVPEGGRAQGYLNGIVKSACRARDVVRQILTVSRKAPQQRRSVDLAALVEDCLGLLRATLPATIEIRQRVDPQAGNVLADPAQLHQVLLNLCTNAHHAMKERGGVLEVTLEPLRAAAGAPGAFLRLTVTDTGAGMDAPTLGRIFEPYFTTKPVGEGSGLGLAVVHGIVTGLGGAVSVVSEPGRGSTFQVDLPRGPAVAEPAGPPPAAPHPRGRERLLGVDDEPALTEVRRG